MYFGHNKDLYLHIYINILPYMCLYIIITYQTLLYMTWCTCAMCLHIYMYTYIKYSCTHISVICIIYK